MQRKLVVLIQEEITKERKERVSLSRELNIHGPRTVRSRSYSNEGHMTESKPRV